MANGKKERDPRVEALRLVESPVVEGVGQAELAADHRGAPRLTFGHVRELGQLFIPL